MVRIAVTGAAGRMGRTIIQAASELPDMSLALALEHPDSPAIGADAGQLAGIGKLDRPVRSDMAEIGRAHV